MGFETQEEAERYAEAAEFRADQERDDRMLARQDKNGARAKRDAEEIRGYLVQLDRVALVEAALKLYENGQRLRYDLDDIMGVVR